MGKKRIIGISCFYHDSAATLIIDNEIVAAAQEERFSRIKHDPSFPVLAINYCLEEAGIADINDIDAIVFYDNPYKKLERILQTHIESYPRTRNIWEENMDAWATNNLNIPERALSDLGYKGQIFSVPHHISHASSAFYPSPFDEAAILTVDGVGERATASICHGSGNKVEIIKQMNFPHSLGLLYSAFTYFTGFRVNGGEYKLMGLAPYGKPVYVDKIKKNLLKINSDGSIVLNMDYFGFLDSPKMTNSNFASLFGGPAREPETELTQRELDLARSIQVVTEEIILKMAKYAKELTNSKNLCMAGGVALNCVANGKILKEKIFDELWIQPASGDAGCSLGSAFYFYYAHLERKRTISKSEDSIQLGSYWGPEYSDKEISSFFDTYSIIYKKIQPSDRAALIANLLAQGKIVGNFMGRMEFGPRALGNRSILGDARSATTQLTINLKIKYRESFRPFAPSVLSTDISDYFELDTLSPFMLLVAQVNENRCIKTDKVSDVFERVNQKRSDIPAVTHVDNSARIQSVSREHNSEYFDIINEFKKETGFGVIVNTSFNVRGEPIVCTPEEAYSCFINTEMDVLAIGNYLVTSKKEIFSNTTFRPHYNLRGSDVRKKMLKQQPKEVKRKENLSKLYDSLSGINHKEFSKGIEQTSNWSSICDSNIIKLLPKNPKDVNTFVKKITSDWKNLDTKNVDLNLVIEKILAISFKAPILSEDNDGVISDSLYVMY